MAGGECAYLGVKGDGKTDDTAALRAAIDSHCLYFPDGNVSCERITELKPDTLIRIESGEHINFLANANPHLPAPGTHRNSGGAEGRKKHRQLDRDLAE